MANSNRLFNSFYLKLAAVLLGCFVLVGVLVFLLVQQLTTQYQNEVEQKLHLELAAHLIKDNPTLKAGEIEQQAVEQTFHSMMILGPSFEFYILNPDGTIRTYAAEPEKIKRNQVSLDPIHRFLDRSEMLPIMGDDPRSSYRQKIFSAAEIKKAGELTGYLYIIIGGEIYDDVVELLRNSHIMQVSVWGLITALAVALVIMLILFALITRPLKRLARDMESLQQQGFARDTPRSYRWRQNSGDEIQQLGASFATLVETLNEQYQKVKSTDELRRELISYVSHDLRTPLASLQGYLETWQLKHQDLSAEASAQYIQIAINNAQHISKLVEQLFELAHLDAENVQLTLEPISIAELSQDIVQKLQFSAAENQIQLSVSPKDSAICVEGDIEKLERAITNLVDNAIRHSHPGDTVSIELSPTPQHVKITVRDSGIGIPQADLPHIFKAHYRAANSVTGDKTNSGLGLAITQRIIELHGSELQVSSQEGVGTAFCFELKAV